MGRVCLWTIIYFLISSGVGLSAYAADVSSVALCTALKLYERAAALAPHVQRAMGDGPEFRELPRQYLEGRVRIAELDLDGQPVAPAQPHSADAAAEQEVIRAVNAIIPHLSNRVFAATLYRALHGIPRRDATRALTSAEIVTYLQGFRDHRVPEAEFDGLIARIVRDLQDQFRRVEPGNFLEIEAIRQRLGVDAATYDANALALSTAEGRGYLALGIAVLLTQGHPEILGETIRYARYPTRAWRWVRGALARITSGLWPSSSQQLITTLQAPPVVEPRRHPEVESVLRIPGRSPAERQAVLVQMQSIMAGYQHAFTASEYASLWNHIPRGVHVFSPGHWPHLWRPLSSFSGDFGENHTFFASMDVDLFGHILQSFRPQAEDIPWLQGLVDRSIVEALESSSSWTNTSQPLSATQRSSLLRYFLRLGSDRLLEAKVDQAERSFAATPLSSDERVRQWQSTGVASSAQAGARLREMISFLKPISDLSEPDFWVVVRRTPSGFPYGREVHDRGPLSSALQIAGVSAFGMSPTFLESTDLEILYVALSKVVPAGIALEQWQHFAGDGILTYVTRSYAWRSEPFTEPQREALLGFFQNLANEKLRQARAAADLLDPHRIELPVLPAAMAPVVSPAQPVREGEAPGVVAPAPQQQRGSGR